MRDYKKIKFIAFHKLLLQSYQCEKMFCIAMCTGGQAFEFSYLHLEPPQKIAHCMACGVNFRKFSENLL